MWSDEELECSFNHYFSMGLNHKAYLWTVPSCPLHTASAVGVELPTLSGGSGGHLDHLTNRAFPDAFFMMLSNCHLHEDDAKKYGIANTCKIAVIFHANGGVK